MNRRSFLASLFAVPLALKTKFFPVKEIQNPEPWLGIDRTRVDFLNLRCWGCAYLGPASVEFQESFDGIHWQRIETMPFL